MSILISGMPPRRDSGQFSPERSRELRQRVEIKSVYRCSKDIRQQKGACQYEYIGIGDTLQNTHCCHDEDCEALLSGAEGQREKIYMKSADL